MKCVGRKQDQQTGCLKPELTGPEAPWLGLTCNPFMVRRLGSFALMYARLGRLAKLCILSNSLI